MVARRERRFLFSIAETRKGNKRGPGPEKE